MKSYIYIYILQVDDFEWEVVSVHHFSVSMMGGPKNKPMLSLSPSR